MTFIRGRAVVFLFAFVITYGNDKDTAGLKLVTFPGSAALWPSGTFYSSPADAINRLDGYNTVPGILSIMKMHINHAVACRQKLRMLCCSMLLIH